MDSSARTPPRSSGGTLPELSVVVPCYECAPTVDRSIEALSGYLDAIGLRWELVLVDDGSRDGTGEILERWADGSRIVALRLPENRGKGRAVARGMLRARGACRIFTDADLPYELDAIPRCVTRVDGGSAVVFGNRRLEASDARRRPWHRTVLGGLVQWAVGGLLGRSDVDTQCGFKAFAGPVAEVVFGGLRTDGFLFDVEVTLVLTRAGVQLDFVPVVLVNHDGSTVHPFRSALRTLQEAWTMLREVEADDPRIVRLRSALRSRAA